ncbi:MAG: hypothetical protein JRJ75_08295 [Deltaproteobacteria bacterium]|nr:hypothetical protein [Deltaproteobacteria bacterium]
MCQLGGSAFRVIHEANSSLGLGYEAKRYIPSLSAPGRRYVRFAIVAPLTAGFGPFTIPACSRQAGYGTKTRRFGKIPFRST